MSVRGRCTYQNKGQLGHGEVQIYNLADFVWYQCCWKFVTLKVRKLILYLSTYIYEAIL
jgi:hypothetical protein